MLTRVGYRRGGRSRTGKDQEKPGVKNTFEQLCLPEGSRILIVDENEYTITANAEVTNGGIP